MEGHYVDLPHCLPLSLATFAPPICTRFCTILLTYSTSFPLNADCGMAVVPPPKAASTVRNAAGHIYGKLIELAKFSWEALVVIMTYFPRASRGGAVVGLREIARVSAALSDAGDIERCLGSVSNGYGLWET